MDNYKLDVKTLQLEIYERIYDKLDKNDRQVVDIDFSDTPERLKREYLDVNEECKSESLWITKCDEN